MTTSITTIYLRKNDRGNIAPLVPSQTPDVMDDYKYQIETSVVNGKKTVRIISGGIVGTRYYDKNRIHTMNSLENQPGYLLKEPTNKFDSKAIAVYRRNWFGKGIKVGYVASIVANTVYNYLGDKTKVKLDDCGMPYFVVK